jgi:hypothetical protein
MLVITHKIYSSPSYTQVLGALSTDALVRFEVGLPLDRAKLNRGKSISDAMRPVTYCKNGRRLKWFEAQTKTNAELYADMWNTSDGPLVPPFSPSSLIPFSNVVV